MIPIIIEILDAILFICEYYFICLCIVINPEKINKSANSILLFPISILGILICF